MFDVLTYQKGGALLRMLEQYLGEERFRDGIRQYLAKHSYGSTETSDLWDALEAATGDPVRRIMDTWIWQGGYPLVTVRPSDDGQHLALTQRRFLFDGDDDGSRWAIPVIVRQRLGDVTKEDRLLLDGDEARVAALDPAAVVVVNAGSHGFYRVAYEDELLERLTGHDPRRERAHRDHARMPRHPQGGAAAHRMPNEHDRPARMRLGDLVERPPRVLDRVEARRVPPADPVAQVPDLDAGRAQSASQRDHPQVREVVAPNGFGAVFPSAVQHEHDGIRIGWRFQHVDMRMHTGCSCGHVFRLGS